MITIAEAIANPLAVVARSGENASEATSAACTNPSALWLISRIENNRRKSAWRSASRVVPMRSPVALIAPIVGADFGNGPRQADRNLMRRLWLMLPAVLVTACYVVGWFGWPAGAVVQAQNGLIAFQSDRDGDAEIFTVTADGSALTQLTTNDTFDGEPSWSPDGSEIAFVRAGTCAQTCKS